ncbi:MAG: hypothetical protein ACT4N4_10085 [Rhodospirillales bacterium]
MNGDSKAGRAPNGGRGSLSTRRGFLAAASFGVVSLYGLWAGIGLAPLNIFAGHDDDRPGGEPRAEHGAAPPAEGAHAGHGAASGPGVEEFRRQTEAFVAKFRLPDGSVAPHAGHGAAMPMDAPVEVYLLAQQWFFEPGVLRLEAGRAYRFRMMAADMSHGASIQLGSGSHVIRLRRGVVSERDLTFKRAGEYLVYCTVYCGVGHDRMAAKIVVA